MSEKRLKAVTAAAMLTALSVVFERVLTITPPSNLLDFRITFGDVPIILAGLFISPVMGGLSGLVSDVIGCFISGYPPFPLLMPAPIVTGFLPGFVLGIAEKKLFSPNTRFFGAKKTALIAFSVATAHVLSSFLITTYGLSVMRGVGFLPMLITRLPSGFAGLLINTVSVCILYKPLSKIIKKL